MIRALSIAAALTVHALAAAPALSEPLRIATYNAGLSRQGPGLLLRDLLTGKDRQAEAAAAVIAASAPGVLLLTGFDYDHGGVALAAFAALVVAAGGPDYPHRFALRPNTGMQTGLDLDGDGRIGGRDDAQGFGEFSGESGMALLSLLPIDTAGARDHSAFLWRDLPGALIDGAGLSAEAGAVQRLSTTGHWQVPVLLPGGGRLTLLAWYATPPVFDGPEDRNGRRNHDEARFWTLLLDGALLSPPPEAPFVLLGDSNLDPEDGDGRREAIRALLSDPRLQDPAPTSQGGRAAADEGAPSNAQGGDPTRDTANWPEAPGPGNLRVDLVLPSAGLKVTDAGVWWPEPGSVEAGIAATASRHRLVWIDLDLP